MRKLLQAKRMRWALAAAVAALALSCAGLLLLRDPAAVAGESLEAARARWAANGPDAYALNVRQETRGGICDQRIEARGEQVVGAPRNSCGQPATWTVTRLMNWIVELERTSSVCYPSPSDCACQATAITNVSYDATLGYPRTIVYEWRSRPNLVNPAYWRMLTDRTFPGCSNIQGSGTGGTLVVNIGLEPEP